MIYCDLRLMLRFTWKTVSQIVSGSIWTNAGLLSSTWKPLSLLSLVMLEIYSPSFVHPAVDKRPPERHQYHPRQWLRPVNCCKRHFISRTMAANNYHLCSHKDQPIIPAPSGWPRNSQTLFKMPWVYFQRKPQRWVLAKSSNSTWFAYTFCLFVIPLKFIKGVLTIRLQKIYFTGFE